LKEIKFRAWNKVDKTMYTDAINNCKDTFDMILKHPQVYEVMQYAGLRDICETEVYEGDIVKFTERNYEDCSREELIGIEESIQIVVQDYYSFGLRPSLKDTKVRPFIWIMGCDCDIEVIGNIYENSEFLEGEVTLMVKSEILNQANHKLFYELAKSLGIFKILDWLESMLKKL
jgi:uncharacterized phage protein (TIGR01671 family)